MPECKKGCKQCKYTQGTCTTCAKATCMDGELEPPEDCIVCPMVMPECETGCKHCEYTKGTCTTCAKATCMDGEPETPGKIGQEHEENEDESEDIKPYKKDGEPETPGKIGQENEENED